MTGGIFNYGNRSELAQVMFKLGYLESTCDQILARVAPSPTDAPTEAKSLWAELWAKTKEYLSSFVLLYRAFRMVPWGLVFLAGVSTWKFLWPYMQRVIAFFGG